MKGLENLLNQDEILFRVHKYQLGRKEGGIFIDIHEHLFPKKTFVAIPTLVTRIGDSKYIGTGKSKEDALKDCLQKIKAVPIGKILLPEAD